MDETMSGEEPQSTNSRGVKVEELDRCVERFEMVVRLTVPIDERTKHALVEDLRAAAYKHNAAVFQWGDAENMARVLARETETPTAILDRLDSLEETLLELPQDVRNAVLGVGK